LLNGPRARSYTRSGRNRPCSLLCVAKDSKNKRLFLPDAALSRRLEKRPRKDLEFFSSRKDLEFFFSSLAEAGDVTLSASAWPVQPSARCGTRLAAPDAAPQSEAALPPRDAPQSETGGLARRLASAGRAPLFGRVAGAG
jgi:hypothetical protein